MLTTKTLISLTELRRLLSEMAFQCPDIGVRFRMLGEMWSQHFANILFITDHGLVLNEVSTQSVFSLYNLERVVQFEIDQRFKSLEPFFHYEVVLQ